MKRFIIKRLGISLLILLGICIFMFVVLEFSPGNPYIDSMKPGMSPEQIENMLRQRGYYDPIYLKFFKWFMNVLRFDFGYSIKYGQTVASLILEKLPNTLFLTLPSLILAIILSIYVGRISAFKGGIFDKFVDFFSGIGISMPTFLIAILFIKWFAFDFSIFPISGTGNFSNKTGIDFLIYKIYHSILPILVLTVIQFSSFVRYVRAFMLSVKNEDYIRTYQGFGMTKYEAYREIGFRNILPSLFTIIFMEVPNLISGALITETIFVWPGIGKLNYDAVFSRDYPLIMGIIITISFTVLISNLLSDILNFKLDKRIGI